MADSSRHIKHRIASVSNMKQITRAMEAVAATKMRRAQEVALRARPYARAALSILAELPAATREEHPLFAGNNEAKPLYILLGSDKGLCGAYNSGVTRAFASHAEKKGARAAVFPIGRKMRQFAQRRQYDIAPYEERNGFAPIEYAEVIDKVAADFSDGAYSAVYLCFTRFVSTLKQEPVVRQLLPFTKVTLEEIVAGIIPERGRYAQLREEFKEEDAATAPLGQFVYDFEPAPGVILDEVLGVLLRVALYHALVEAEASEHSARMVAMKNASDNASGIIEELRLTFNKARQMAITSEVSEITSGKEALASG